LTTTRTDAHLVALPGTKWMVWRDLVLRTTGFPADGLDRLSMPGLAAATDAHLDGQLDAADYASVFDDAAREASRRLHEVAGDPRFREAVAWQNPTAMLGVDGLLRSGPEPRPDDNSRTRVKRGLREDLVAKYWQRYCGKNETTGFFGPVGWARFDPDGPPVVARPGSGLVRDRRVFLEQWALAALADRLAEDPEIRPWLPAGLPPHVALDGRRVLRPAQPPLELSRVEAAVLAGCDGRRPVADVARDLVADPGSGLRKPADVHVLLERLVGQGLVVWGVDLPLRSTVEERLRGTLAAIPVSEARDRALESLRRLTAGRDATVDTAGDADRLLAALAALDAEFVSVTGRQPRRRDGETYAGRTLCFLDATRDLDLVLGRRVLEELARPLAILLQAARWLTVAIADAYGRALRELYEDVAADLRSPDVPMGDLWFLAQGMLFGAGERPVDSVTAEFSRRWSSLFGLDARSPGTRRVALTSDQLEAAAAATFAADRPGWAGGRIHSPDLHLCATSAEAAAAGDFTLALGEMHAAWATFDSWVFVTGHPAPGELRDAMLRDLGPDRLLALIPGDWPRITARIERCLDEGWELGFAPAPGPDRDRLVPITTLTATETEDGSLVARDRRGRTWPLIEVFSGLVSMHAVDAFKLVAAAAHTPRISIDRLVVARETWLTTIAETGLAGPTRYRDVYVAARRWQRSLGLPERVFARISTERKPVLVDFTSPRGVSAFCAMVRAAQRVQSGGVGLALTEMLPGPDQAWVPDAEGRRYSSELRLQVRDPEPAWPDGCLGAATGRPDEGDV
jgi:hypothetical protein